MDNKDEKITLLVILIAAAIAGWKVGKSPPSTTVFYVYEYVNENNNVTKGFACKCVNGLWRGIARNNCEGTGTSTTLPTDKPYKLSQVPVTHPVPPYHGPHNTNSTPVPTFDIPTGSCCRTRLPNGIKPTAPGLDIFVPFEGNC